MRFYGIKVKLVLMMGNQIPQTACNTRNVHWATISDTLTVSKCLPFLKFIKKFRIFVTFSYPWPCYSTSASGAEQRTETNNSN